VTSNSKLGELLGTSQPVILLPGAVDRFMELAVRSLTGEFRNFDPAMVRHVIHLVRISEFKRKQAAPGLKVTDRAFGTGWRMPIAARLTEPDGSGTV